MNSSTFGHEVISKLNFSIPKVYTVICHPLKVNAASPVDQYSIYLPGEI